MDLFYQDFKADEQFLSIDDFIELAVSADAKLKIDEYNTQALNNLRQRKTGDITMSSDNYVTVNIKIQDSKAKLPTSVMWFPDGKAGLSIASVFPEGNCKPIMPVTQQTKWEVASIKNVVFWLPYRDDKCEGIEFLHLKGNCNPSKVEVTYIPVLNEKSIIQESRKWAIYNMVIAFIKQAEAGVVIDSTNDGNANMTTQTEINRAVLKRLQSS